jgi:hypothetical protein
MLVSSNLRATRRAPHRFAIRRHRCRRALLSGLNRSLDATESFRLAPLPTRRCAA